MTSKKQTPRIYHVNGNHLWTGFQQGKNAAFNDCDIVDENNYCLPVVKLETYEAVQAEIEILRSNQSQYESTLTETITERDKARAEIAYLQRQLADAMSGCCDCPTFKSSQAEAAKYKALAKRLRLALDFN